jgi:hypothetical protein
MFSSTTVFYGTWVYGTIRCVSVAKLRLGEENLWPHSPKGAKSQESELEDAQLVAISCWAVGHLEYLRFARCYLEWSYFLAGFHVIKEES